MFCLWLVNKRHDLKTKIVPESPRYTLSCSHDLSTTSPNPLHSLTQSLHLSFLSHEWEHKSSRGVVGSMGFLSSHSTPILCPSSTQYALLGQQPLLLPLLLWHLYFPISAMWGPATILLQHKIICFWRWKLETLQPAGQGFHLWLHDFSDGGHQIWHLISWVSFRKMEGDWIYLAEWLWWRVR